METHKPSSTAVRVPPSYESFGHVQYFIFDNGNLFPCWMSIIISHVPFLIFYLNKDAFVTFIYLPIYLPTYLLLTAC